MKFDSLKQFTEASLINRAKWLREASTKDVATAMGHDDDFRVSVFKSVGKKGIISLAKSKTGNYEEALARLLSIEFVPHKQKVKRIVAWVNKADKKQLEKYTNADIYFATSLEDFEKHINSDCIPVFSLVLAASTYKKVKSITSTHPEIMFYFLQKRRIGLAVKTKELFLRGDENTEPQVMLPDQIIALSGCQIIEDTL